MAAGNVASVPVLLVTGTVVDVMVPIPKLVVPLGAVTGSQEVPL